MNLNKLRSFLYRFARVMGDINAVEKGRVGLRIIRRTTGKIVGQLFNKIFR